MIPNTGSSGTYKADGLHYFLSYTYTWPVGSPTNVLRRSGRFKSEHNLPKTSDRWSSGAANVPEWDQTSVRWVPEGVSYGGSNHTLVQLDSLYDALLQLTKRLLKRFVQLDIIKGKSGVKLQSMVKELVDFKNHVHEDLGYGNRRTDQNQSEVHEIANFTEELHGKNSIFLCCNGKLSLKQSTSCEWTLKGFVVLAVWKQTALNGHWIHWNNCQEVTTHKSM